MVRFLSPPPSPKELVVLIVAVVATWRVGMLWFFGDVYAGQPAWMPVEAALLSSCLAWDAPVGGADMAKFSDVFLVSAVADGLLKRVRTFSRKLI